MFRRAGRAVPEVAHLKRALARRHFDLLVDCHEDVDAPGLYVLATSGLGQRIVEAAAAHGPVHPGPLVDGELPVARGVIELDLQRAELRRRTWRRWPLPFYVAARYRRAHPLARLFSLRTSGGANSVPPPELPWATVETPPALPLAQRVDMHLAAIQAAVDTLFPPPTMGNADG